MKINPVFTPDMQTTVCLRVYGGWGWNISEVKEPTPNIQMEGRG